MENTTVVEPESVFSADEDTILMFLARGAKEAENVYANTAKESERLLRAVKALVKSGLKTKLFCITHKVAKAADCDALSQAALFGLARIIQSEEPEVFGGLIDVEDSLFPMQAIKWVQGVDVIRIQDCIARNARLQPLGGEIAKVKTGDRAFRPHPQGTYIITGGLGALGLEAASSLAEKWAKRLVLLSRRSLPPRRLWGSYMRYLEIQRILSLEAMGVSIYALSIDITSASASCQLQSALDGLSLTPVLGVVHAAGTLFDQMVTESMPKRSIP